MHEVLVGLQVLDDTGYQAYRDAMTPVLNRFGGDFSYDFKVSEVLRSATPEAINRVFTLHFPDADQMDAFFADADYLQVKERYFQPAVASTTIIAAYDK